MPLKRDTADDLPLNLTPMIDVVFLLVIFFMTATQFAQVERAVDIELSEVDPNGAIVATANEPRVVSINAAGDVLLDGEPRSLDELKSELSTATDAEVVIHGDARCELQHVLSAAATCRAAGVASLDVIVETAETIRR